MYNTREGTSKGVIHSGFAVILLLLVLTSFKIPTKTTNGM